MGHMVVLDRKFCLESLDTSRTFFADCRNCYNPIDGGLSQMPVSSSMRRTSMPRIDKTKPVPGFANPRCYASGLAGCCRQINGEHWVSRSIIELVEYGRGKCSKGVSVRKSRQEERGESKSLGVASLTGNILCTEHNGRLSALDVAGKKMFEAMESVHYGCRAPQAREKVWRVDGDLLERFLLKVLCGGLFSGNLGTATASLKGVHPPLEWLRILYERAALPERQGLYYIPAAPNEIIVADHDILDFTAFFTEDFKMVCGLRAWFFGIEFDLLMVNLLPGIRTSFDDALHRPSGFRVEGSSARIEFAWKDGPKGDEIRLRRI
jgi:hypothetical protein